MMAEPAKASGVARQAQAEAETEARAAGRLRRIGGHLAPVEAAGVVGVADAVTKWELFKVPPRWVFLRLETRNGVVGWGEPNCEGYSDTVMAAVKELMDMVVGQDPSRIQYIWQKIYRQKFYSTGSGPIIMSALAGIDQALWDIAGKTLNVPVHRLLGGAVRDRLLVYRWCGGDMDNPEDTAREAKELIANSNFKLLKMNACPMMRFVDTDNAVERAASRIKAVREAVGPDVGIGLDFHGRVKVPAVKRLMKALEPYNPLFFEEPVVPEQNGELKGLRAATHVPIATGERMYTPSAFRDLLASRGAQIIQPDCSHVGGISSLFQIARMAEAYDVALAPHCPLGPIALAACVQVDACSPNFVFQETSMGIHYNKEGGSRETKTGKCSLRRFLRNPEVLDVDADGHIKTPQGPGLGIIIDEEEVRKAAIKGHNFKDREWTLPDGTPTRW